MSGKKSSLIRSVSSVLVPGLLLVSAGCVPWDAPEPEVKYTSVESAAAAGAEARYLSFYELEAPLTNFPSGLYQLNALAKLSMRGNVWQVPEGISGLKGLTWLDMGEMKLASLPGDIGGLPELRVLYLTDNQLTSLPESFGSLASLEYVNLDRNKISTLPASIGQLAKLKWLRLNGNQLKSLPAGLGGLPLQKLYLRNNQLTAIPAELGVLGRTLQELFLEGNPIAPEDQEAIKQMFPNTTIYF